MADELHKEDRDEKSTSDSDSTSLTAPDSRILRRATLKLDLICLSSLTLWYFLSFLDRTNIGNAKVAGLQSGLGLTDHQYAVAITVTYTSYIAFEVPSNLLFKYVGARNYLPLLAVLWGATCLGQGFVDSFGGLCACRFLIGMFESGLVPGTTLLLSEFYRRRQLHLRLALFFSMTSLAGAFGGLLAYGITKDLDGVHGKRGWQWIFIIEGAATVGVAALMWAFHLVPNSPQTAWYLSHDERSAVLQDLKLDGAQYVKRPAFDLRDAFSVLYTNRVCLMLVIPFACGGFVTFGTAYFSPSIVAGLGFDTLRTQLMIVPPYALAFCIAIITAFLSDRIGLRAATTASGGLLAAIGYTLQFSTRTTAPRYFALFLQIIGIAVYAPAMNTLLANNVAATMRRAVAIAVLAGVVVNCGGLASTWVYPTRAGPRYRNGSIAGMSAGFTMFVFCLVIWAYIRRENRRRDEKLDKLPADFPYADGPLDDRDLRFRFEQ